MTNDQVEPIAKAACTVLEKVGVLCQNNEVLKGLEGIGCQVDWQTQIAKFPPGLVRQFAEELRKEHPDREPKDTTPFPKVSGPILSTQVAQLFHDYEKQERRNGTKADFVMMVKLGEMVHREATVGHCLLLTDVHPVLEPFEAGLLLAEYASHPAPPFGWNVSQWDYLIEMGEILGYQDWCSRGAICFAHPLRFDKDVADRFARQVREGHPTGLTSMAVAGATAPVTLEGYVVVAAAEHIATWIAARALNPNVPLRGSMWSGTVDMRTGAVSYCNFDAMIYAFATVEFLRRWTGMQVVVGGGEYCDAKVTGMFAALEKAYKSMMIAAFTGQHYGIGQGMLDEGKVLCPVQFLLERELTGGLQHLSRSLEVSAENLALDSILEVGVGLRGSYLETDHTLRHFRTSLWNPQWIDRSGFNGSAQEKAMLDKVYSKVKDLTASYQKPEVDPDKLARMKQVVERAKQKLLQ